MQGRQETQGATSSEVFKDADKQDKLKKSSPKKRKATIVKRHDIKLRRDDRVTLNGQTYKVMKVTDKKLVLYVMPSVQK